MKVRKQLNTLINGLTPEQLEQVKVNLGECDCLIEYLVLLLNDEILIFDGKESLFYKRTGLQVWEPFK